MTRRLLLGLALLGVSVLTMATAGAAKERLAQAFGWQDVISGIDYVPDDNMLQSIDDVDDIIAYARGTGPSIDVSLKIRAYRTLGQFTDAESRQVLADAIDAYGMTMDPTEMLYLRAAVGAYALRSTEWNAFEPLLLHSSPDVRAEVARALTLIGDSNALDALLQAHHSETTPFAKWELAQAINQLSP